MKIKKILFSLIIFLAVLVPTSNANTEKANLDLSKVVDKFNKCYYTSALSDIGVSVKATKVDNSFVLTYNNSESITYAYDKSAGVLSTSYPITDDTNKDILSALFIDAISTLEGNEEGSFIFPALNDTFCYTSLKSNGVAKNYISSDGGTTVMTEFQISTSQRLSPALDSSILSKSDFNRVLETFISDKNCIVKNNNLILLKSTDGSGNIVLYIGQPTELLDNAYESILNAISYIISMDKDDETASNVVSYIRQNYSGLSNGNSVFDGVNINTDIDSLPDNTLDTILVSRNMKYAKFTINTDTVISNSKNISPSSSINDSTSISKKHISPLLGITIGIIVLIVIIIAAGFFIKKHTN